MRPDGKSRTSTDTWTRDGNTVKHDRETTLTTGKKATSQSTIVKDGNKVTRETIRTGPNGDKTIVYSIREWHPELNATKTTTTRTTTEPTTNSTTTTQTTSTRRSYRGAGKTPRERAEEIK